MNMVTCKCANTFIQTYRLTDIQKYIHAFINLCKWIFGQIYKYVYIQTFAHTYRHTNIHAYILYKDAYKLFT